MSTFTIQISDELAEALRGNQDRLGEIVELGLRELKAQSQFGFDGAAEVLEFLARLPNPSEILSLRPSPRLEARVLELFERNRVNGLSAMEEAEWERYEYLEHLVRMAKAAAYEAIQSAGNG